MFCINGEGSLSVKPNSGKVIFFFYKFYKRPQEDCKSMSGPVKTEHHFKTGLRRNSAALLRRSQQIAVMLCGSGSTVMEELSHICKTTSWFKRAGSGMTSKMPIVQINLCYVLLTSSTVSEVKLVVALLLKIFYNLKCIILRCVTVSENLL